MLEQVTTIVTPDTILRWHRELVAGRTSLLAYTLAAFVREDIVNYCLCVRGSALQTSPVSRSIAFATRLARSSQTAYHQA